MKLLSYFQSLGFTRNEIKLIVLLSFAFLVGLGIRYYNSSHRAETNFDYSIPDSIFQSRSQKNADGTSPAAASGNVSLEKPPLAGTKSSKTAGAVVNINNATKTELMRIPGIGAVYAERIVAYRNDHGPFKSVDELAKVKGIGKKRMNRLRPFVCIE